MSGGVGIGIENDVAMLAAVDDAGLLVAFFGNIAKDAARLRLGAGHVGVTPWGPEVIHGGRVAEGDGAGRGGGGFGAGRSRCVRAPKDVCKLGTYEPVEIDLNPGRIVKYLIG